MRKVIAIGECVLDTIFRGSQPERSFVGGRIMNAAASLASAGVPVEAVSECGRDGVGDIIVNFLESKHVSVRSIDRFTDGHTALSAIFPAGDNGQEARIINYGSYPPDRFDVVWPRINQDDIIIFGSLYSVEPQQRERLFELITHAVERKAIIVYLPGFQHGISVRITHVMPAILENLEISNIVITHDRDIRLIFPGETGTEAYRNHFEFYCQNLLHVNSDFSTSLHHRGDTQSSPAPATAPGNPLGWQAGLTAGLVHAIITLGITRDNIDALHSSMWSNILSRALQWANACDLPASNCIPADFAAQIASNSNPAQL